MRGRSRPTTNPTRNLMAKDDFKNLGFAETPPKPDKGVKGELRW